MKLAFISDIHGNATALHAVLEDVKKRKIDQIFILGDICYRGLEPQTSLDLVQALNADVIKGNADEWVVRGVQEGEVPEDVHSMMNKERDWTVAKLKDEAFDYLKNLPTELNLKVSGINIHAFHATPHSLFDVVQPDEPNDVIAEKLMSSEADLFIYGHIHKPYVRFIDGKCVINTGSVGLPFDGLNKSSYAIVEIQENHVETSIIRVNYDVHRVIEQFKESDYPNKEFMIKILTNAHV